MYYLHVSICAFKSVVSNLLFNRPPTGTENFEIVGE